MNIVQLRAETLPEHRQALAALLIDSIQQNMSSALQESKGSRQLQDVERYFHSLRDPIARNELLLWVAIKEAAIVGSVQLSICQRPGGQNRAEVLQLLVHSGVQHEGIEQRLVREVERGAEGCNRGLLYLNVIAGSSAERFYRSHGYLYLGELPDYAMCANGQAQASAIYFKRLRINAAEKVTAS